MVADNESKQMLRICGCEKGVKIKKVKILKVVYG
jgi:hypothetical protein